MFLIVFLLAICTAGPLWGQLALHNGTIVFRNDGHEEQLTHSPNDYDPSFSCDGKSAVFVRRGPNRVRITEGLGERDGNQLWAIFRQNPISPNVVLDSSSEPNKWVGLSNPKFSADGESIFFMNWFGNGSSLNELSLKTRKVRTVTESATEFWVLCSGPFRGGIVVHEDDLKLAGGHIFLYWLYAKDGTKSLVGTTESELGAFLGHQP